MLGLLALLPGACGRHAVGVVPCRERVPDSSDIQIAAPDEPGDRLEVSGTVYRRRGNAIPGAIVYVYHSDAKGLYAPIGVPDAGPRLCGILRTDAFGRYRIRTIMPGHAEGTPHMHFEVWGAGIRHQELVLPLDVTRRGSPPPDNPLTAWAPRLGREPPPVTRDSSGVYRCHWDVFVD